jgi:hypothetical protein
MLGRALNLYFITKYKNISTRKPKYCRAAMRIKEFILYGLNNKLVGITRLINKNYNCYNPGRKVLNQVPANIAILHQCYKNLSGCR